MAADPKLAVGDDASSREEHVVEIRVAVPDGAGTHGLLSRLAALFGRSSVSFDGTRREVRIHSEWESRSVLAVIDAIHSWLAADGVDSTRLSIGGRSYTMPEPALAQTERAAGSSVAALSAGEQMKSH